MPYLAVRLRGHVKTPRDIERTMQILGLKRINAAAVLPENPAVHGMLKKVENFITYGTISAEDAKNLRPRVGLNSPRGGLKSVKLKYPKGDLGYRAEAIKEFVKRM